MRRNLILSVLCLLTFRQNATAESNSITIAEYGEFPLYVALYLAEEKGFFKDNGLAVRIVPAGGDEKVFAALVAGDAQFGVGDPTFTAIAGERGQPGKVIFSLLESVPQWGLTKNDAIRSIKNPAELGTYKVATYPAPSTSYTLQKWMFQKGKLKPSIVEIPFGALIPALDAKQADIILEYEPFASLAEAAGARRVYTLSEFFPEFALTGVTALPDYIERNRDTALRVVRSLLQASAFLRDNQLETSLVLSKRFPSYTPDILLKALKNAAGVNTFTKDGIVKKTCWDNAIKLRKEVKDLKREAPFEHYVDLTIVKDASAENRGPDNKR